MKNEMMKGCVIFNDKEINYVEQINLIRKKERKN